MSKKLITTQNIEAVLAYINSMYAKSDVLDAGLASKSDTSHTHDGRYYTEAEIDELLNGKANTSHGTHVTWSTTTPKANGTATVGTETKVARGDHVHPLQTTVSGNAGSATKLETARTLTIGSTGKTFDGSGNVSWSLSEIGAAAASHNHDGVYYTEAEIDELLEGKANTSHGTHVTYSTTAPAANGTASAGTAASVSRSDHVHPLQTTVSGNAGTATKLAAAKNITIGNKTNAFDGSEAITFTLSDIGAAASSHNHDGVYYTEAEVDELLDGKADSSHGTHVTWATNAPKANGTAAVGTVSRVAREDHVHPLQTTISGNAGSATVLETARTLTIGSTGKTFDGSGNVSWSLSEIGAAAASHNHDGVYYTESEVDELLEGKADSSHGTHVTYSTTAPKANGTAAVGTATTVSRSDHVHPLQTTISGNAGTATKLAAAKNITIGNKTNSFDGSAAITFTLSDIGAAASGHNHDGSYYTEAEVDDMISELNSSITTAQTNAVSSAKTYTDSAISNLIDSAPDAMNTLNELASAITDHQEVYDAYVASVSAELANKASSTHTHTAEDVGARAEDWVPSWSEVTDKPSTFAPILGTTSTTAYRGDHGLIAYNHSQAAHAPSNAQKNSDITKAEIEAKLTGSITSHNHDGSYYTEAEVDELLDGKADSSHGTHVTFSTTAPAANGTAAVGTATTVSRSDHVHPLQTTISGNAGSATKVNNNLIVKLNGGSTEGTNLFTFNGSAAKTVNITASSIGAAASSHNHDGVYYTEAEVDELLDGKADSSHGTHVTWSTTTPKANGTAAVGTETKVARGDHVHPLQTTVSGNAGTATKLAAAKNITIGNKTNAFDGSEAITFTLSDIGAAAASHNHDGSYYTEAEVDELLEGKANASHGTHVTFSTTAPAANGTAAVGTATTVSRSDHVHPLQTTISGNAGSATKVNNSLVVKLNSGTTEGTNLFTFNGSAAKTVNITPSAIGAAASSHNHDGTYYTEAEVDSLLSGKADSSHGTHVTFSTTAPKANGTAAVGTATTVSRSDHVHPLQTTISGNAGSATKVNNNLIVKLNGGSTEGTNLFTFNGSAAKTVNITASSIGAAASSHNHDGTYYTEAEVDSKFDSALGGATISVVDGDVYITY